ncbi:hypothetical protein BY996DRAFT_6414696 [Phakopsora pachyrhizi]|nr:hypothetical protein BY996DRAFT_6414696 [Phakopsora pachyrhizi]
MFSRALPIVLCLMFMISNISALATHTSKLEKRNSPDGLFTDCRNAVIKQGCNAALDDLWNNGKIKRFTTEHQYANHPSGCKLTWWTDGGVTRPADDQKYTLQNALQERKWCLRRKTDRCIDVWLTYYARRKDQREIKERKRPILFFQSH